MAQADKKPLNGLRPEKMEEKDQGKNLDVHPVTTENDESEFIHPQQRATFNEMRR